MRFVLFTICMLICMLVLTEWTIFGLLTLAGLIGLIENISWLKWLVYRTSTFWDIIIFGATIIATVQLGVTITASLTIASIGFTFAYRPYIQAQRAKAKASKSQFKHRL